MLIPVQGLGKGVGEIEGKGMRMEMGGEEVGPRRGRISSAHVHQFISSILCLKT